MLTLATSVKRGKAGGKMENATSRSCKAVVSVPFQSASQPASPHK